ncbi:MAG: flagellar hook-length control protein FliK [Treponema sp.]|nr:flagellar hook-length control protein FliK [Treponema sp.]
MVAIEHNPTHIDSSLLEGRAAHSEGAENRLDGLTRKKGRKNNGLGVFSKLLAGLVSKKPLRQGENIPKGSISPKASESGTQKTVFPNTMEVKGLKNPKEKLSAIVTSAIEKKENKQKETVSSKNLQELPHLNFEFARFFPPDVKEVQTFTFQQTSLKSDNSGQIKDVPPERKIPFKRNQLPENTAQGDSQKVSLQPKAKTEEKPLQTEGESKKAGKKRNSFSVEVYDLRTQTGAEAGTIAERGLKAAEEARNSSEREIAVDLRPERDRSEKPLETGQRASAGENFEQILARELRGELSADIVRQAAIVLRDGGEGTIKLSLKPETLGKVKIHLEMAENRISGLIFVENEEALRAFEQEIHTLEQSFRDSGFEASLNAALDYQDGGQRWKEKEVESFYSERFAVSYEESSAMEFSTGFGYSTVNVFA